MWGEGHCGNGNSKSVSWAVLNTFVQLLSMDDAQASEEVSWDNLKKINNNEKRVLFYGLSRGNFLGRLP
jgi:hypothetical protein